MKVLHVGYSDLHGGAARAAYRIHRGLCALGVDSWYWVLDKRSTDPRVLSVEGRLSKAVSKLLPHLDRSLIYPWVEFETQGLHSSAWIGHSMGRLLVDYRPDIVHLHWIGQGVIRLESLRALRGIPVVWRLADAWAFCGGEHYPGASKRYVSGYESGGPASGLFDFNRWVFQRKQKTYQALDRLHVVCPSRWMKQLAEESFLFRNTPKTVIPTGTDTVRFQKTPQAHARKLLGLEVSEKTRLLLFSSLSPTSEPRKGFSVFIESLKILKDAGIKDFELLVLGMDRPLDREILPFKAHYLGKMEDDLAMGLVYSAADYFVAPSLEENLANTVLEAMACETPCIVFSIGGMVDPIQDGEHGFLAQAPASARSLAEAMERACSQSENQRLKMGALARQRILSEFEMGLQAKRMQDLYRSLLEGGQARPDLAPKPANEGVATTQGLGELTSWGVSH